MGAPSIFIEKIFAGDELLLAAEKMQIFLSCNEKDLEYTTSKRGVKYVKNLPSNEVNKVRLQFYFKPSQTNQGKVINV